MNTILIIIAVLVLLAVIYLIYIVRIILDCFQDFIKINDEKSDYLENISQDITNIKLSLVDCVGASHTTNEKIGEVKDMIIESLEIENTINFNVIRINETIKAKNSYDDSKSINNKAQKRKSNRKLKTAKIKNVPAVISDNKE